MNRRKKAGNNGPKPHAQPKSVPTAIVSPSPPAPSAIPARVSPPPKPPSPQNAAAPPKPAPPPARAAAQPPRPAAPPSKPPMPTASAMKMSMPAPKFGPSQRRVLTRSDRVRAEWLEFEGTWVKQRQLEVEKQLSQMLDTAEKSGRVKGRALEQQVDRIVSTMRNEFAMAARNEWESRLGKAGLQAEDWADMTLEEMAAVEQVLSCEEESGAPQGVYALSQPRDMAPPTFSAKPTMESPPPLSNQPMGGRATQASPQAPPPAPGPSQKAKAAPAQSWAAWASSTFTRQTTVSEVPEEPPKPAAAAWGSKNAPIIEEVRAAPKTAPAPPNVPQPAQPVPKAAHAAPKATHTVTPPPASANGMLSYAVPLCLTMPALDAIADSDPEFVAIVDKLYVNSLRQFHMKAADADAGLARQLRKPMPAGEREWTLRAHMMSMEQMARDIVERRDTLLDTERRKRGWGDNGGETTPTATRPVHLQPPGAFPDDHIRAAPVPEPAPRTVEAEPEREPEPDVDEVIEIPLKGKAAKKGKKAAQAKAAVNGRSTPTPPAPAARVATPTAKVAPAVEKKIAPVVEKKPAEPELSPWARRAAAAAGARPASPAPINTKAAPPPVANGRATPAPLSPWEAAQAAKANGSIQVTEKPPSPPNGMWAPPMARATSSKNPYAPTRPSRLAHVSEPESPEPESPPPTVEPTGKDYVAWFAGSSSEDEGGAEDPGLTEDEDEEDDEDDGANGAAFGGLLASLAGNSPWAMFGEGNSKQAQKERGRTASPARARGPSATPTPGLAAGGRFGADAGAGGGEWMRWGAGGSGAGPSSYGAGPSSFGAGPSGFGSMKSGAAPKWKNDDDDDLDDMLELASKTLDRAATGTRGVNMEEAMAMFVTAQKARETLATPVGGRAASAWRR